MKSSLTVTPAGTYHSALINFYHSGQSQQMTIFLFVCFFPGKALTFHAKCRLRR